VDVTIAAAASAPYKVQVTRPYMVHSLTIDQANATLNLTSGLTAVNGVTLTAGSITLSGGSLTGASSIAAGASLSGAGTVTGAIADAGLITARAGLDISGPVTGTGSIAIATGGTLELGRSAAPAIKFSGTGDTLILDNVAAGFGRISGFAAGDALDLKDTTATTATLSGSTLNIFNGTTKIGTLKLSGNYAGKSFSVTGDGAEGSKITVAATAATKPATTSSASSPNLLQQYVAAGFGGHAAAIAEKLDHLASAESHPILLAMHR
jgi:hypothetical protein